MRRKDLELGEERPVEIVTPLGTLRGRYYIKAACQSLTFVCVAAGYGVVHMYTSATSSAEEEDYGRLLQEDANATTVAPTVDACASLNTADPPWLCTFYAIGVLYMFLALAIVCDEFFVPALEEMSSSRRLNLSMDVAGATLMAAGGSAPELFTSLFGTFQESEIGFGTIVGSAVFNVLFVIAMCSLLSFEVLQLTWWPLFRDSLYYAIGLVVLAIFVGVNTPDVIEMWEALVLFAMYFVYILIMWKNASIYKFLTGKVLEYPDEDEAEEENGEAEKKPEEPTPEPMPREGMSKHPSKSSVMSNFSAGAIAAQGGGHPTPHFRFQGTFRAGILKLLKDPNSWMDTAGLGIVAKIAGDADYVFQQVDMDGNGHVDREELKQLFNLLECYISPGELEEVFQQLDEDNDGTINQREFTNWYCRSEERILSQVRHVFDKIDANKSNTIDKDELKTLLAMLDPHVTDEHVEQAIDAMYKHGSREEITFEEFSDWYKDSIIYERQKKMVQEDMEGVWENLYPPKEGSCRDWTWYIVVLPLVAVMTFTIPDVRRPGLGRWCYLSFFLAIAWIGFFSFLMVTWAEIIGNTIGIPSVIMGLTVLAAGTSVPDLLSSVIVARRGSGDMAVSSSIGSNIFDILVGLPIPWILFTAWPNGNETVSIVSGNLFISLFILLGMLGFVIVAIHCQGWRLTKTLGGMMLVFYAGFLTQAIVLELPFVVCT
jgi:K+-dependent Na+/Ca+ exchanger-like protein